VSKLPLTLACWDYDRTRPLIDGRVQPQGIDLNILVLRPHETFPRMLERQEFHVSELSLASYTTLKARGACPFVAVPVALSKIFRHSCIYVRPDAGIATPQDLKGKRVGTMQYGSTGSVFMRGMLQHEYGVAPEDVHWFMGALDKPGPPPLIPLNLPPTIRLDFLTETQTLEGMLEAGELDAFLSLYIPSTFQKGSPRIARLFPNYKEVEQDYYRRTRIFPIMHTVVIRGDVYEAHPWVAGSLTQAFAEAKARCREDMAYTPALRYMLPWLHDDLAHVEALMGEDYWPDGVEPNRHALETFARYSHEQGIAVRRLTVEELFAPPTVDTFRT
jgi:4,5-dihydroxyphthalate decarboxylase